MNPCVTAILAGGLGTRLRSVISDGPKPLASVGGRPFLMYLLDQLVAAGVRRVVLLTGYRGEQIYAELGDSYRGLALEYSQESEPRGTAGALRFALPKLFPDESCHASSESDSVFVLNGDSYCAADLKRFYEFHEAHHAKASLLLAQVDDTSRFGKVELAANHRITRFCEKEQIRAEGWINAGIYLINKQQIEEIPSDREVSIEREMFPNWSRRGILFGFCEEASLLDIGTPESYRSAELFLSRANTDCTVPAAQAR